MVKWTFLTGLDRTTVENCGKMVVFDRTEPEYGGKLYVFDRATVGFVLQSTTGVILE